MSYILDALRKSDQERQRGAAPTLIGAQATANAPRQPALLAYALLALVLLAAGVAIGWWRPWQHEQDAPPVRLASAPTESTASPPAPPVPPALAPEAAPQVPLPRAVPVAPSAPRSAPAKAHTAKSASAAVATPGAPQPATVSREAVEAVPAQRANKPAAAAAPAINVIAMTELPVAIQQELPAMSITVHAYSTKPAERLVGINSRLLREGDEVAPGLLLERITPDGMILSFKGYSFRRGVR